MRGFILVSIIIQLIIVKTSRRKKFGYALLNLEMDERKGKQKRDKTNYLIKQQLKQITISMMLSRGTS